MTGPAHRAGGDVRTAADMVNQVEGYLLWRARIAEAEDRAREFTERLPWLTGARRTEIEQQYVADSLQRSRTDLERVAARCHSLRAEYESRYCLLRRRCVASALTLVACVSAVAALLLL
ncbi:cytochrome C oxidase subunit I [Streptomyces sediminimaris]|uniref:cytochrome C oxidase subunit I n=1 Tax=Streptomyces sediminimaris TaxID=3383721 RepID=UPI00399B5646